MDVESLVAYWVCVLLIVMSSMITYDVVIEYINRRKERKLIESGGDDDNNRS